VSDPNDGRLFLPLDVNFFDDPEILAAGEKAGWLYLHMLTLSKRTLSDGFVADAQVRKFGLTGMAARLSALAKDHLIERRDGGWFCSAYAKRNRSAAEIRQTQRLEREAAIIGNHRRWHVEGKTSPRCDVCASRLADPMVPPTRVPDQVPDLPPESTETRTETRTRTGSTSAEPSASARAPDLLFEAVAESCGYPWGDKRSLLTKSARGELNTGVKQLRDIEADPAEVATRVRRYRKLWPNAECTATALAKHWHRLEQEPVTRAPVSDRNRDTIRRVGERLTGRPELSGA
jgi:hypothetical protein